MPGQLVGVVEEVGCSMSSGISQRNVAISVPGEVDGGGPAGVRTQKQSRSRMLMMHQLFAKKDLYLSASQTVKVCIILLISIFVVISVFINSATIRKYANSSGVMGSSSSSGRS